MTDVSVELVGGPLDGERLEIPAAEVGCGVALPAPGCTYPGGRSVYDPRPGGDPGRLYWAGDTP